MLKQGQLSSQYQLVVTREALLDEVTVCCELTPEHQADLAPEKRSFWLMMESETGATR